jgi:tetratricopeptide (TPR) repeat protein
MKSYKSYESCAEPYKEYAQLGDQLWADGAYEDAKNAYMLAIFYLDDFNGEQIDFNLQLRLAECFEKTGNLDEANKVYERARDIAHNNDDHLSETLVLAHEARLYIDKKSSVIGAEILKDADRHLDAISKDDKVDDLRRATEVGIAIEEAREELVETRIHKLAPRLGKSAILPKAA